MSPEWMAALVARWVRVYTRDLPEPVARRRVEEIDADLHDHIADGRERGVRDGRIALGIAARMLRGLPADAAWRGGLAPPRGITRSIVRVALVTAFVLLLPVVAGLLLGGVDWSTFDFVLAGVLVAGTGLLLELALRRPRTLIPRLATAVIGVAAIAVGESDDAPGLVLLGCVLLLATFVVTRRAARRSD
jgi:hypothetical protein